LIDDVIEEPVNGAHRDKEAAVKALASYFITELEKLEKLKVDQLLNARIGKILAVGAFEEGK
jgi:acetyl-CoA carboxylase, carboxyl transferase, alpha subunit